MIDINKFDDLEDLPVSEEMLGAYLEGNLHGAEFREIQNCIHDDSTLSNFIDGVEYDLNLINPLDNSSQYGLVDAIEAEDAYPGISLPEIDALGVNGIIGTSSTLNDGTILGGECDNFMSDDGIFIHSDNPVNNHSHHDPELDHGVTDCFE